MGMEARFAPPVERVDDAFVLRSLLLDAEAEQFEANRRAVRQCEHLADVLEHAREHPGLYVSLDSELRGRREPLPLGGEPALAERCAVLEASSRLRLSERDVRESAALADRARAELPRVWTAARDGLISVAHVRVIVSQLGVFADRPDAVAEFDALMRDVAIAATVSATRRQARDIADRLTARTRVERHAGAFARRHVYVEDAADGMSWVCAMVATERAHGIDRALTSSAKRMTLAERDGRTDTQIRADLFAEMLGGGGSDANRVKVKVLVTVPLDRLAPEARASVRTDVTGSGDGLDLNADCLIPGVGPIDDATARQLLLDAGAFTRVITDPVTGVILDMDRRSRRATRAQRDWLALRHGTCVRDGCERLAIDADIDHHCAFHGPDRGATDIANLDPLCDPDHALKDTTRLKHRRRDDGTVEVEFPSGHRTRNPFAGMRERVRAVLDQRRDLGDDPPF